MKKTILFGICHVAFSLCAMAWQGDVTIETPNTQLLLTAQEGGDLRQSYYGDKNATLQELRDGGGDLNFHVMPAFGTVDAVQAPALQVQHVDGDLNLEGRSALQNTHLYDGRQADALYCQSILQSIQERRCH
jgi:alpha-galactosidase